MSEDATPRARSSTPKRVIQGVVSLALVVGIFVFAIPRIADYHDVWATIQSLTPMELWSLVAATAFNLFTYWLANMAALPGLRLGQAAVVTQTTTSVANTIPAGGAIAVGLTYQILGSWGFSASRISLYVLVTGIWNVFLKLGLPIVSLGLLALTGELTSVLVVAAIVGVLVLLLAVALFGLVLWKKAFARRIGDGLAAAVSWLFRIVRRPPVSGWGEAAVRFRKQTIQLVAHRWPWLTFTTVLSHLALYFVLLLSLRHVGVSEQEVSWAQVLAVFAFGRLIGALPITPGGLGVIELGYIGGLVAAGGNEAQVVAAVLLFRVLTYGVQIPIGAFTYVVWRRKRSWRRPVPSRDAEGVPALTD
ncbi:MAG TPA: YbhN family protein [Actinomycetota bacterium]|nr:YbhN family protein [Actinomycetota bacterium]